MDTVSIQNLLTFMVILGGQLYPSPTERHSVMDGHPCSAASLGKKFWGRQHVPEPDAASAPSSPGGCPAIPGERHDAGTRTVLGFPLAAHSCGLEEQSKKL